MSVIELRALLDQARAKATALEVELLGARQVIEAHRARKAAEVTACEV